MQQFIGRGRWSADELRDVLQEYVGKISGRDSSTGCRRNGISETGKDVSRSAETIQRNSWKNKKLLDRSIYELCSKL